MTLEDALEIADRLARPTDPALPHGRAWWPQSLAHGVPGIALLHTELAAADLRPWRRVHDWLTLTATRPLTTGPSTGLFYGAPAVAYALAAVATVHPGAYRQALQALDQQIAADAHRRAQEGGDRIRAGRLPVLAEFDLIRGLAGLGTYLLRRRPGGAAVRAVLDYLVQLTKPLTRGGTALPGWWTPTGPAGRMDEEEFPGGHGNAGMAHGISGPLALLATATLHEVTVPGQKDAIHTICAWLDSWRLDTPTGPRWPYLITRDELDTGPTNSHHHSGANRRPSWCYGTAGLARAQQLAAQAHEDLPRQCSAEDALLGALNDPAQLAMTSDASLCHRYAGLASITARAATDADTTAASALRKLSQNLLAAAPYPAPDAGPGLLEGSAGTALSTLTLTTDQPPATGWDACLLIT
ncbi:lanthionine synthetase C family protein [Streptomyces sp. NPDC003077]|uniref:lanthionine synthetase C family protein n=1 Tax=Streptomyces sp. NPDC003077 TaxID=3154443 RepID=UPI0033BB7485